MPTQPASAKRAVIDRQEVAETFVDTVVEVHTHQGVGVATLATTRPVAGDAKRMAPVVTCRLVLTLQAMIELGARVDDLLKQLESRGLVKRTAAGSTTLQ